MARAWDRGAMQAHDVVKAIRNFTGMEVFGVSVHTDDRGRIDEIKIDFVGEGSKAGTMFFRSSEITPSFTMSREYQAKVF